MHRVGAGATPWTEAACFTWELDSSCSERNSIGFDIDKDVNAVDDRSCYVIREYDIVE